MDVPHGPVPAGSPIVAHYAAGQEAGRLESGVGQLEAARTRELLERYLPSPPARVADAGGGPGAYAVWLAGRGYTVDLIDLVPLHVEPARRRFAALGLGGAPVRGARGWSKRTPWIRTRPLPLHGLRTVRLEVAGFREVGRAGIRRHVLRLELG